MVSFLTFICDQLFTSLPYPTKSCAGQTIIVTGSNVGLGKEAARHFARLGASKVILAVRNVTAGEAAKLDIERTTSCKPGVVEVWALDLSSYGSVKAFADRVSNDLPRIDAVVENAGIATPNFRLAEGYEQTLTVNVISTFLLALLLLPKLRESARKYNIQPRLAIVSSEVHAWAKFAERDATNIFDTLNDRDSANMGDRYQVSKLLEILAMRAIAPGMEGKGVILNMLNPGLCHSSLSRDSGVGLEIIKFFLARSTEVGSRTLVAAAQAGPESHGRYMDSCRVRDHRLAPWVRTDEGKAYSNKIWGELRDILDKIQPGITDNMK